MTGRHEEERSEGGRKLAATEPSEPAIDHRDENRREPLPRTDLTDTEPLFAGEEGGRFRQRWDTIQAGFVDEPREAVEHAAKLVGEVMTSLEQTFADERSRLENAGNGSDTRSTEDLRQTLRRYRAFFDRLLAI
jgi:hypothetical protein